MKKYLIFALITIFFIWGTTGLAKGLTMDKVSVTTKHIEDEDTQNWLYFTSYSKSDALSMRLFGKVYFPQLDDKYEDTSRDGLGDLYSSLRVHLKFPGFSQGFKSTAGYKWNQDYQIYMAGTGYDWKVNPYLSMGLWCDGSNRLALASGDDTKRYHRQKQEFSLNYTPKPWRYSLILTRSDYNYPEADTTYSKPNNIWLNEDYSVLSYTHNHKLNWQTTSKLNLGVGYRSWTSDYYHDQEGTYLNTTEPKGKKDGEGTKTFLEATYIPNKRWTWHAKYSQSDSDGYNGTTNTDYLGCEGKYTDNGNWWMIAKLRLFDLDYSRDYTAAYEDPDDKDADYSSRQQQVLALDFHQKLKTVTYGIEPFVKNYDYVANTKPDRTTLGIIGTLNWQWLNLDWYLLAAPKGTLTTRKGIYILRAQYKF
jgi:hypothetical protein